MLDNPDDKAGHCQGWRIFAAGSDSSACMAAGCGPRLLVKSAAEVALLMAPRDHCVRNCVIRVQSDCLFEEWQRLVGILRHRRRRERQGPQIQVPRVEAVRALAPGTL